MKQKNSSTVDETEIANFTRMAGEWWDTQGKFKPLHDMNPLRIQYIVDKVQQYVSSPLKGLNLLDIGCGGGLICEPMARLGAHVTGIDAGEKNIEVAKLHAQKMGLNIDYRCMAAEELAGNTQFDVVLALEIIEHVADFGAFAAASAQLLKPGGLLIYSTLNRTAKSYALAIIGAEYVLRWLPRGTHDWKKFVKPSELCRELRHNHIEVTHMTGMVMNPLDFKWRLEPKDVDVNYFVAGRK